MRIKILSSAMDDLHAGRIFYERQGEGVGAYFFDSLFPDIDSLPSSAGIHPKVYGYHRLLSKRFPCAIYYTVEEDLVVVWRILDLRRHPNKIWQALGVVSAEEPAKHGHVDQGENPVRLRWRDA